MSTLAEIEQAIPQLTASELEELEQFVRKAKREKAAVPRRSVLDMEPLDLGRMLRPLGTREEWYDEMRKLTPEFAHASNDIACRRVAIAGHRLVAILGEIFEGKK